MKTRDLLVVTSIALVLLPACAADPAPPRDRRNVVPTPPAEPGSGEDGREIDVSRPDFQAKSSAQLARSVEACVGRGATTVSTSMIATPENASGFLTSDFADGNDIVEVQKLLFDGTAEAMRTGVR